MAFNRFCRAAVRGERLTVFGDGSQTRDFTYVADVVAATRAAARTADFAGKVYNIGGGSRTSVNRALEIIGEIAGRPLEIDYEARESGDVRDTGADTNLARSELGFSPCTDIESGLSAEFAWMFDALESAEKPSATAK